jgi:hypothetical protein
MTTTRKPKKPKKYGRIVLSSPDPADIARWERFRKRYPECNTTLGAFRKLLQIAEQKG